MTVIVLVLCPCSIFKYYENVIGFKGYNYKFGIKLVIKYAYLVQSFICNTNSYDKNTYRNYPVHYLLVKSEMVSHF